MLKAAPLSCVAWRAKSDMPLSETASFRPVGDWDITEVDGGIAIYQPATETLYHLNATAARVFQLCAAKSTFAEIGRDIQSQYGLPEPPSNDVADCIKTLLDNGLIEPRE